MVRGMRVTIDETLKHIRFLARLFGKDNIRYVVVALLLELGIPTNYDGFEYLVKGITIYFREPSLMITKGLYPVIAETSINQVEGQLIESAIRNAIKTAWRKRDGESWACFFPGVTKRPSNAEFISRIAYMLDLWEGCCKEYERIGANEEGVV